jgi:hypothetical protein
VQSRSVREILIAAPLLTLPLFVVPALCFALNGAAFVWSLIAIGFTAWRLRRAKRTVTPDSAPVRGAVPQLVLATLFVQMLAFTWIGSVWMLQGAGQLVMLSTFASQIVGWVQAHWFAGIAAWLVLFAVVCGLFRLARPILAWHQRTIINAAHSLTS